MQNFINEVKIAGIICKEPEYFEGKSECLKFTIITKSKIITATGKEFEKPTFHNIILFGEEALKYKNVVKKDLWILAEGEITQDKSSTTKRYYTNIKNPSKLEILNPEKIAKTNKRKVA